MQLTTNIDRVNSTESGLAQMIGCEGSARDHEALGFPQATTHTSPLETRTLCETLLRDFSMELTPDRAASAVEQHPCPNCDAPAGSACRTRGGKTTAKYHTPRFVLVPVLREELDVPVPADRGPGRPWTQGPTLTVVSASKTERPVRIGYARTSTTRQELASQLEALRRAECHKIFHEQISTRVKVRPELEKALALAHQFKEAAPETPVVFTVHELERLAATPLN